MEFRNDLPQRGIDRRTATKGPKLTDSYFEELSCGKGAICNKLSGLLGCFCRKDTEHENISSRVRLLDPTTLSRLPIGDIINVLFPHTRTKHGVYLFTRSEQLCLCLDTERKTAQLLRPECGKVQIRG